MRAKNRAGNTPNIPHFFHPIPKHKSVQATLIPGAF